MSELMADYVEQRDKVVMQDGLKAITVGATGHVREPSFYVGLTHGVVSSFACNRKSRRCSRKQRGKRSLAHLERIEPNVELDEIERPHENGLVMSRRA